MRVRGDTRAQIGVERRHRLAGRARRRPRAGVLARRLEVDAVLDQLGAEATHRRVLVGAVAVRHDDRDGHARGTTGERQALAVVAAGRADDAADIGPLADEPVDVHQIHRGP